MHTQTLTHLHLVKNSEQKWWNNQHSNMFYQTNSQATNNNLLRAFSDAVAINTTHIYISIFSQWTRWVDVFFIKHKIAWQMILHVMSIVCIHFWHYCPRLSITLRNGEQIKGAVDALKGGSLTFFSFFIRLFSFWFSCAFEWAYKMIQFLQHDE